MKKPNFFIVGAAKAGTTSLYSYLDKHPDVFMSPIKEPHYFSKDIRCSNFTQEGCRNACFDIKEYLLSDKLENKHISFIDNIEDYLQLFREVKNEDFLGEVSTGYLYSKVAAKEIYDFNPDAKIIIVLRNPVQRTYSHWKMNVASGVENIDIPVVQAIKKDYNSINKGYCQSHLYIELGQYSHQIKRYTDIFPKNNIKILFFDDLKNDADAFMSDIYKFLNIAQIDIGTSEKENVSVMIKFQILKNINNKFGIPELIPKKMKIFLKKLFTTTIFQKLTAEDKSSIYFNYFKKDVEQIEDLLNLNLSSWKYEK
jgi:hypothetical protein